MSDQQPETILVVDDRPATRYATTRVIQRAGYQVLEAATGMEALLKAQEGCDLIVLDINLPDIDGNEVCRRIRQNSSSRRVPVIHLSASFISDEHKIRGFEAGADGYLTHPVDPLVLIATIRVFLRARQTERDLAHSEARLQAIFDHAQTGICLFHHDLRFLDVNPALREMIGLKRDDLLGQPLSSIVSEEFRGDLQGISRQLEQHSAWHGTLPLVHSTGRIIQTDWKFSAHSEPGLQLAVVTDMTEKLTIEAEREHLLESERAARLAAERANRLKDEFLATLSHELRTPLNAILGWTQVLRFRPPSPEDLEEGLATVERNARAQAELINDLLDVSRIISGKVRLELQTVDPVATVREALASVQHAAQARNIRIEQHLDCQCELILGDPGRLQQVIWNLVNNAVKFTPPGGWVSVRMEQSDTFLEISVADSGQGIKPEFLPHLFERFRQEDASTTRTHGGLGLGLAIVKHLIELHGGHVTAHSEGEGRGAQFVVQLPRQVHAADVIPVQAPEASNSLMMPLPALPHINLRGTRILIVDDDRDSRTFVVRFLKELDADVLEADTVPGALHLIEASAPQILVSDIGMPNQDGYDLIREVRQRGYTAELLPAIALTAFARDEDRERVLRQGYQTHLGKPIAPDKLIVAVAGLLKNAGNSQTN